MIFGLSILLHTTASNKLFAPLSLCTVFSAAMLLCCWLQLLLPQADSIVKPHKLTAKSCERMGGWAACWDWLKS